MAKKTIAPKGKESKGKELTAEQLAKREARKEALKNRPEGQRTNSKQIDIVQGDNFTIETYGYAVRKMGTLVTTVLKDVKGNPVSTSTTFVPGCKTKSKKGHGYLQFGVAGAGKNKAEESEDSED